MKLLNLIIAEASLETIPQEIWNEPAVVAYCRKRGRSAKYCLLDVAYHHRAMRGLRDAEKRGRPDIVHSAMLAALETPFNEKGLLRLYVHTYSDYIIYVNPAVRLPKNYNNFIGLIEQLFEVGRVPPRGEPLLTVVRKSLPELISEVKPDYVVALTTEGRPATFREVVGQLSNYNAPAIIVGGFQKGHFSEQTKKVANELVAVGDFHFMTSVVVARVIYEFELKTGVYEQIVDNLKRSAEGGEHRR